MTKDDAVPVTVELLPCPFCGGEASADGHIRYSKPLADTWWEGGLPITEAFYVNCIKCGAVARSGLVGGYQTKAEAIERWNARHRGSTAGVDVEALRIAKSLLFVIDGIEAHCRNDAGLKGEDHADDGKRVRHAANLAAESARQALASLSQTPATPMVQEGLREALAAIATAEAEYRHLHDLHGDGDMRTGRAWDWMRRKGDDARRALSATPAPPVDETDRLAVLRRAVEAWAETDFFGEYDEDGKLIRYSEERAVAFAASEGGDVQMAVQATFAALAALATPAQEGEVQP